MTRRRHRRLMERSRQNKGVTSLVRRNQAKRVIVWGLRVLVVILAGIFARLYWASSNTMKTSQDTSFLPYKLMETGKIRSGLTFQRFAAMDDNEKPVSVQQWTSIIAQDGAASDSLSRVLQVRRFTTV